MKKRIQKRVFVGLSGGVDSAVAAALLKQQGYNVAGVFMRFWKPRIDADFKTADGRGRNSNNADRRGWENSCCSVESEASALAVAQKLGIPFYVFNFEREFKKAVVDYFLAELSSGRTPNPCVVCNPEVKFGLFLERAKRLGADFISTGHYARVTVCHTVILSGAKNLVVQNRDSKRDRSFGLRPQDDNLEFKLFAAKDKQKDQSYFLHRLTQEQLSRVLFPLAGYTKAEVYKLAKQWRLPHQTHQSFDICFTGDYQAFLKKYLKMKPGKIVKIENGTNGRANVANKSLPQPLLKEGSSLPLGRVREDLIDVLGQHQGLPFYTIGQRARVGGPGPFFVVKKDIKKNILYVSNNERDLYQKKMLVEKVNWIAGKMPKLLRLRQGFGGQALKCKIKIRYGAKSEHGLIRTNGSTQKIQVLFAKPQRAITPGQSAVFYGRGGEVLGGGIIK